MNHGMTLKGPVQMALKISRYSIYLSNLDPTLGSEIQKTRPVLVVSPDVMNQKLETVVVCPMTTKLRPHWFYRHCVTFGKKQADIAVDQIRTISKSRLVKRLGSIDEKDAAAVRSILVSLYGEE